MQQDAAHVPLDMAEDMLCGGQGVRRSAARVQPHGPQTGKDLSGSKGFALPQHRLPQPGQQAFCRALLQKKARRAFQQSQCHRLHAPGL